MKKIHRFIVSGIELDSKTHIISREIAHQLKTVLRISLGEQIIVCDGKGSEALGTIAQIESGGVLLESCVVTKSKNEPPHSVVLYAAIIKRDNFELIAQKAVEVGAAKIVPIITQRTIKTSLNQQRIETIVREAAEQSGRGILPEVLAPIDFKTAITTAEGSKFLCHMDGMPVQKITHIDSGKPRSIFIGPEGGWEAGEIAAAVESGAILISFGALVFRAETAAIVATHYLANI